MITLTNNTKGLALLPQVEEIYGKVHTSDSLLETVLYWRINCIFGLVWNWGCSLLLFVYEKRIHLSKTSFFILGSVFFPL